MKSFDINLAKQGHSVCTRDRKPARIICFDAKNNDYPIIALVEDENGERPYSFSINGKYVIDKKSDSFDLMMTAVKHEGWINLYKNEGGKIYPGEIHKSKIEAEDNRDIDTVDTIKIEWEE